MGYIKYIYYMEGKDMHDTIEELLQGKAVNMPPQTQTSVTFAKAPKVSKKEGEQLPMG